MIKQRKIELRRGSNLSQASTCHPNNFHGMRIGGWEGKIAFSASLQGTKVNEPPTIKML